MRILNLDPVVIKKILPNLILVNSVIPRILFVKKTLISQLCVHSYLRERESKRTFRIHGTIDAAFLRQVLLQFVVYVAGNAQIQNGGL
jgi:hypothetical protein